MVAAELQETLAEHLFQWGLRPFLSERDYDTWQRAHLRPADLHQLRLLADTRHRDPTQGEADLAFYEYAAQAHIYPTLYSQRFDYYLTVGAAISERLGAAVRILDVGCGLGILTTFYGRQAPGAEVLGVDRSPSSVEVGRHRAATLGLTRCRFACLDLDREALPGSYDLIIASQTLLQSELDPGLPSDSWRSHARAVEGSSQAAFERRTGLGLRLDRLLGALAPNGRMILCEKTRHLGRRIPFQRALAARGLRLREPPVPLRYLSVEEVTDDGPLYVMGPGPSVPVSFDWNETPDREPDDHLCTHDGPAAEYVWERLPGRRSTRTVSFKPPGMASGTIEWGQAGPFAYLYVSRHNGFRGLQVGPRTDGGMLASVLSNVLEQSTQAPTRIVERLQEAFDRPASSTPPAETPLYENHSAAAGAVYEILRSRAVRSAHDQAQRDGRQLHIEWGTAEGLVYLYCANTYDQRQLVVVEPERGHLVEQYFGELTGQAGPGG